MSAVRVRPGDVLGGKYKVERVLGSGGMGVVVAARHVELGQRVALKFMIKEAMEDPIHAERFLREARASVQLQSVHTARVLDVGKLTNGEPFMVMEYLDGKDLDQVLRLHGPMAPHVACGYVLQASEALAEAHGLGMIHRDVKLKNIFLTSTIDGRPLIKVLDFGLAKQTGIIGDVSLTATSSIFGSPQYMSPEQMRSAKDVDARSDIWSLGVCLYELLTGRPPFDAGGVAEICAMVLKDPVPPPSQFALGLPIDLEATILKCLEKDPDRRFQTVADLAFALEEHVADEGSARRVLQVMESVQKLEIPTLVSEPALRIESDPRAATVAAFETGSMTTRIKRATPRRVALVTLGAGLMLGIAAALALKARDRPAAAEPPPAQAAASTPSANAPTEVAPEPSAEAQPAKPAPEPEPVTASAAPGPPPAKTTTPARTTRTPRSSGASAPAQKATAKATPAAAPPPPPPKPTSDPGARW